MSNVELLSAVIGKHAAQRVYQGSLVALFNAPTNRSKHHRGLHAARELIRRALAESICDGPILCSSNAVRDYLRLHFLGQEHESLVVLFLDCRQCLVAMEELFRGTLDQTTVFPREVVKRALYWNAAAIMLVHNHPSGTADPSFMDLHLTKALAIVLELVHVRILDHFVVSGNSISSFVERGYWW